MEKNNWRRFALFTAAEGLYKEEIFELKHDKKGEKLWNSEKRVF